MITTLPLPFILLAAFLATILVLLALRRLAPALGMVKEDRAVIGGLGLFLSWIFALGLVHPAVIFENIILFALSLFLILTGMAAEKSCARSSAVFALILGASVVMALLGGFQMLEESAIPVAMVVLVLCLVVMPGWLTLRSSSAGVAGVTIISFVWLQAAIAFSMHMGKTSDLLNTAETQMIWILGMAVSAYVFCLSGLLGKKNIVHLGTGGALFLGFVMAFVAATAVTGGHVRPVFVLWLFAFPVFDLIGAEIRKKEESKSKPLYDVLIAAKYTPARATSIVLRLSFIYGGVGFMLALWSIPFAVGAGGLGLAFFLQYLLTQNIVKKSLLA